MSRHRRPFLTIVVAALVAVLGLTAAPAASAAPAFPPGTAPVANINQTVFAPRDPVIVKLTGTTPGPASMTLLPTGTVLGTGEVGRRGNGTLRGKIPGKTPPGQYTLKVDGNGGEVFIFSITVTSPAGA